MLCCPKGDLICTMSKRGLNLCFHVPKGDVNCDFMSKRGLNLYSDVSKRN